MKDDVLGIKIDQVSMDQAVDQVTEWVSPSKRTNEQTSKSRYVVTPNVEFLMLAQKDSEFKKIINEADLAIPDSARLSWAYQITHTKNPLLKLLLWPLFLVPKNSLLNHFDVVTGTDLMDRLITLSSDKAFTVGFLGGQKKLAEKLKERLLKKYPKLKISYASSDMVVDVNGSVILEGDDSRLIGSGSDQIRASSQISGDSIASLQNDKLITIPKTDILFVALGQGKQEKWIAKNLDHQPVKVMIGVGGAFDFLAGEVPRAPKLMRQLGFEWLFRLVNQPWRVKRFLAIFKFLGLVLIKS